MATTEQKQQYVSIIKKIWGDSMQNNSKENISDEVIELMDNVLTQIRECSKGFLAVDITFSIFYPSAPTSWIDVFIKAGELSLDAGDWIDVLKGSQQYKTCIATAALNHKSAVQIALYGI